MKSVGEAMGIGRSFLEAFLKTMRSRELDSVAEAPWRGLEDVPEGVHPWFLAELDRRSPALSRACRSLDDLVADDWLRLKRLGISDADVAAACGYHRGSGARAPARLRRASRLPPRRLVRRRGRGRFELLLLRLGRAGRGGRDRSFRRHPRLRTEPDRPGDRVRLLLRPRGALLPRARARSGDGQLQSGDGLHRLRHLRPALLRAARRRGGAGDLRARAAGGCGHPVRRTDAAQARARARARGLPHPGHAVRGDRPGRGP